ncbi:MAG: hypothetical protein HXS54_01000 [Theionarchaea archaeon]|nr:hypothetical protein [Theionarchaea archaeon]
MRSTLWPHKCNPYDIYMVVVKDARIPVIQIARKLKINPKTADVWWNNAINKQIIIPPRFRRKSFLNFREYVYFLNVRDPHALYELYKEDEDLIYFSVQTGFANFEVISKTPFEPEGDVVLSGCRSDYYVSIPPNISFKEAGKILFKKLETCEHYKSQDSPLILRTEPYEPWDKKDEEIFEGLYNDLRKPFAQVMRETSTYSDKIMKWFHRKDEFGHTVTMYFPQGLSSYLPTLYAIDTEYESLMIHLFSELPTPTVFYKIQDTVMMSVYLPFTLEDRILIRKALSVLQKKELVNRYTNSIAEYFYRPD